MKVICDQTDFICQVKRVPVYTMIPIISGILSNYKNYKSAIKTIKSLGEFLNATFLDNFTDFFVKCNFIIEDGKVDIYHFRNSVIFNSFLQIMEFILYLWWLILVETYDKPCNK